ncbi:hypothetical protein P3L10_003136 [Capsicum annuum]
MEATQAGLPVRIVQPKDLPMENRPPAKLIEKVTYSTALTVSPSLNISSNTSTVMARQTTHNGKPVVIFKASDYYGVMEEECRWMLVGKFTMGRPKIKVIRAKFIEQTPLKEKVRIGTYDFRHVFIDFNTEANYNLVYFQSFMIIFGSLIRMFK